MAQDFYMNYVESVSSHDCRSGEIFHAILSTRSRLVVVEIREVNRATSLRSNAFTLPPLTYCDRAAVKTCLVFIYLTRIQFESRDEMERAR